MMNNEFTTVRVSTKNLEQLKKLRFDFRVEEMNDVIEQLLLNLDVLEKATIFVEHIEKHLKEMDIKGKVCCKICGKDIDIIYEECGKL